MNTQKIISLLSLVAGLCVLTMFLIAIFTGVTQEQFEVSQTVRSYTFNLRSANDVLRNTFTIDLIFICVFTSLFVFLTQYLKTNDRVTNAVADVALAAMLICGFLDFHEDLHILTMLHNAANEIPIEANEISMRMLFSMIKFSMCYLCLFLISFILPQKTLTEKILRYGLLFFFVPIGVLVFTSTGNGQLIYGLLRFLFMAAGFFLLAYNFSKDEIN